MGYQVGEISIKDHFTVYKKCIFFNKISIYIWIDML